MCDKCDTQVDESNVYWNCHRCDYALCAYLYHIK